MTPFDETRLHALLDGELQPAEAAGVLSTVKDTPELRERLCELTLNRALLRQAYAATEPPAARMPVAPQRRGLALAGLVVLAGAAVAGVAGVAGLRLGTPASLGAPAALVAAQPSERIVLHLSTNDDGQAVAVLDRAEGLLAAARDSGRPLVVEVVANGSGIDLLRVVATPDAERVERLRRANPLLSFVACGQTVQKLRERGDDARLLPGTVVATSALDEIVLRLQQGWTYLRL